MYEGIALFLVAYAVAELIASRQSSTVLHGKPLGEREKTAFEINHVAERISLCQKTEL